ncbi:hypothetical protein ID47_05805 [Candidatus Paracaedibacter acanthamoebae]|uniref:Uncharacterized protein n=1 Tax=Candidatus Odyssella acanthamoebae TaxID=91604 RepID=A0A077AXJ3_9PROT|nr:hypothetical protein ID47_05805 [Candidatus Paracaedibacter acanthamoebae]
MIKNKTIFLNFKQVICIGYQLTHQPHLPFKRLKFSDIMLAPPNVITASPYEAYFNINIRRNRVWRGFILKLADNKAQ